MHFFFSFVSIFLTSFLCRKGPKWFIFENEPMEPVLGAEDRILENMQVTPDYKNVLQFIADLKNKLGPDDTYAVECGYEAGCLGYSLYYDLTRHGIKCVILAPTTMMSPQGKRVKTDRRDAVMITQCLCYGGYHAVHISTKKDDSVKEYLRMRDDHRQALKKIKQQISAFCLRHGYFYPDAKWTLRHLEGLSKLEITGLYRETLNEYLAIYDDLTAKIGRFDKRIEELASDPDCRENVGKLGCFLGIRTHTALLLIVETGDFSQFGKCSTYAALSGCCQRNTNVIIQGKKFPEFFP